jgi:putative transposase
VEKEVIQNQGAPLGIDRGIVKTIAVSDPSKYIADELNLPVEKIKKFEEKIKFWQRKLATKIKFSSNFRKVKKKIGKLGRKIRNIRHDFLHKASSKLAKNHSLLVLEKLKVKNMSKSAKGTLENPGTSVAAKSGLNRSILRQGWYHFQRLLEYKAKWNGGHVLYVPPQYTSQTCSHCLKVDKASRKSQEVFKCVRCEYEENADINAAKVILTLGLRGSACLFAELSDKSGIPFQIA